MDYDVRLPENKTNNPAGGYRRPNYGPSSVTVIPTARFHVSMSRIVIVQALKLLLSRIMINKYSEI